MIAGDSFTCLVFASQGEGQSIHPTVDHTIQKSELNLMRPRKNWIIFSGSFRLFQAPSKRSLKRCTKTLAAWPLPSHFAR